MYRRTGAFRRDQGRVDPEDVYRCRACGVPLPALADRARWHPVPGGSPQRRGRGLHGSGLSRGVDDLGRGRVRLLLRPSPAGQPDPADRSHRRHRRVHLPRGTGADRGPGRTSETGPSSRHADGQAHREDRRKYSHRWRSLDATDRRRVFDVGAGVIGRWHRRTIQRALHASSAIRVVLPAARPPRRARGRRGVPSVVRLPRPRRRPRTRVCALSAVPRRLGDPRQLLRRHRRISSSSRRRALVGSDATAPDRAGHTCHWSAARRASSSGAGRGTRRPRSATTSASTRRPRR